MESSINYNENIKKTMSHGVQGTSKEHKKSHIISLLKLLKNAITNVFNKIRNLHNKLPSDIHAYSKNDKRFVDDIDDNENEEYFDSVSNSDYVENNNIPIADEEYLGSDEEYVDAIEYQPMTADADEGHFDHDEYFDAIDYEPMTVNADEGHFDHDEYFDAVDHGPMTVNADEGHFDHDEYFDSVESFEGSSKSKEHTKHIDDDSGEYFDVIGNERNKLPNTSKDLMNLQKQIWSKNLLGAPNIDNNLSDHTIQQLDSVPFMRWLSSKLGKQLNKLLELPNNYRNDYFNSILKCFDFFSSINPNKRSLKEIPTYHDLTRMLTFMNDITRNPTLARTITHGMQRKSAELLLQTAINGVKLISDKVLRKNRQF